MEIGNKKMKRSEFDLVKDIILLKYLDISQNRIEKIRDKFGNSIHLSLFVASNLKFLISGETEKITENGLFFGKTLGKNYFVYGDICPRIGEAIEAIKKAENTEEVIDNEIVRELITFFKNTRWGNLSIGVFSKEKLTLRVKECAESSLLPLPTLNKSMCFFTLGFLVGFFEELLDKKAEKFEETKCIAKNDDICEFLITF